MLSSILGSPFRQAHFGNIAFGWGKELPLSSHLKLVHKKIENSK
jgi:hypothetical protein